MKRCYFLWVDSEPRLLIGSLDGDHLLILPTRREFPDADDYWDGNWVFATIRVVSGDRRLEYEGLLRAEDFGAFRKGLLQPRSNLDGFADYKTMERWLRIHVQGDGQGHFRVECGATGNIGIGDRVDFTFDVGQAELPAMISGLDEIVRVFPVRGSTTRSR